MSPKQTNHANSKTYSKITPKFEDEVALYQKLYDLEFITRTNRVNKEYFDYCKSRTNFVILVLYDKTGRVFLKDSGINQFKLVGGTVFDHESVRDAVKRIVYQEVGIATIEELEPIALSQNMFCCEGETIKHSGVVIMARVDFEHKANLSQNLYLVNQTVLECVNQFSDKKILELFVRRFSSIVFHNINEFQDEEIETNRKYRLRYKFHSDIVKKYFLTSKRKKKDQLIESMSKKTIGCAKFLDVSCGDNSLLFSLNYDDNFEFIVANDISWSQIELIQPTENVFFTNHNAITFPFKDDAFDFVYCSNTLHHMPNRNSLNNLLTSLLRVGKKVVIFEIEDPKVTGGFPYYLNKYWYRGFLKDAGEEYLSQELFEDIISKAYKGKARVEFSNFRNIQGNYMIVEIEKDICE